MDFTTILKFLNFFKRSPLLILIVLLGGGYYYINNKNQFNDINAKINQKKEEIKKRL